MCIQAVTESLVRLRASTLFQQLLHSAISLVAWFYWRAVIYKFALWHYINCVNCDSSIHIDLIGWLLWRIRYRIRWSTWQVGSRFWCPDWSRCRVHASRGCHTFWRSSIGTWGNWSLRTLLFCTFWNAWIQSTIAIGTRLRLRMIWCWDISRVASATVEMFWCIPSIWSFWVRGFWVRRFRFNWKTTAFWTSCRHSTTRITQLHLLASLRCSIILCNFSISLLPSL